jgi:hypothetical protein
MDIAVGRLGDDDLLVGEDDTSAHGDVRDGDRAAG